LYSWQDTTFEKNIETDVTNKDIIKNVNWVKLAINRVKWRTVMADVMNYLALQVQGTCC
jgi:hypothetical protein